MPCNFAAHWGFASNYRRATPEHIESFDPQGNSIRGVTEID